MSDGKRLRAPFPMSTETVSAALGEFVIGTLDPVYDVKC